jgi:argininosuccinate lyase
MVRKMLADGKVFEALTPAEWKTYHPAFGEDVMKVVTPQASVRAKKTPQSTNPDAVRAQLAEIQQWLVGQEAKRP